MDDRNKSGTCKRGNSRLLDTAFETKPIKERTKDHFLTSQMHTSTQETLRLILHDALFQRFHSIQCNLVNELTTYQNHGHLAINNHIQGLQESFAHTNQFISLP